MRSACTPLGVAIAGLVQDMFFATTFTVQSNRGSPANAGTVSISSARGPNRSRSLHADRSMTAPVMRTVDTRATTRVIGSLLERSDLWDRDYKTHTSRVVGQGLSVQSTRSRTPDNRATAPGLP